MDYKKVKKEAIINLKHNYLKNVIIVFICTILISGGIGYSSKNILNVDFSKDGIANIIKNYSNKSNSEILDDLLEKIMEEKEYEERIASTYTHGVIAILINEITATKSAMFRMLDSINQFLGGKISIGITIIIVNLIGLIFRIFLFQVFEIGKNRYFLEQRRYLYTNIDRCFYPYKKRRTLKLSLILLIKNLYLFLWSFTIFGWFIKYYEYVMVPYILAENPNIKAKEAFTISKELTDGEKFNIFKVDLTLIAWGILGLFTFNIANIFFTNIYKETLYSEIYMNLRTAKRNNLTFKELLDDNLLNIDNTIDEVYPVKQSKLKWLDIDINKSYSLSSYIMFFFTFSFIGYLYEILVFFIKDGTFVNRGTLYGPWLPIYGWGGILIVFLLKKFRKSPLKMFIASFILCGILEYGTAWFLETYKHVKYWDYTGHFMNLHGRICLECLILFGLGGCGFSYLAAPLLDNIFEKINKNVKGIICLVLISVFLIDTAYVNFVAPNSGEGITTEANNTKIIKIL